MNKYFQFSFYLLLILISLSQFSCQEGPSESDKKTPTAANAPLGNIAEWNEKITAAPNKAELYAGRANAYLELDGYDEAINDLSKAISIDSMNVEYMHQLADVYLDYFKSNRALKTMEQAAALFPERIPTLLKLAEFQLILRKHNRSLISIDRILKLDPLNAEAFYLTGRVFEDQGETDKAIRSYQKAVEYEPDLAEVWVKLGFMLEKKKDPKAIQYFDNAILVDSLNVSGHFARASYLHNNDQLQKAVKAYQNIHRISPQYADAYYNCGLAYLELDSVKLASDQFGLAVKMKPTHIMAYYYRGIVAEMKGDIPGAKKDFQHALNLNPGFERAQLALDKLNSSSE